MSEQPSDAGLPANYDATRLLREQQAQLDAEERAVTAQPVDDDPGDDYTVAPPVLDDDDAGYDPLPS